MGKAKGTTVTKAKGAAVALKEEPENSPVVKEKGTVTVKKYKPILIKDMCDYMETAWKEGVYGAFKPESAACKECIEDFSESAKACEANTKYIQAQTSTTVEEPKKEETPVVESVVEPVIESVSEITPVTTPVVSKKKGNKVIVRSPLGSDVTKGTGKIELLLTSETGASMAEMEACRGSVRNCLYTYQKRGVIIEKKTVDNVVRYFAKVPV